MTDYLDVPGFFVEHVRVACAHLPEAYEQDAFAGVYWRIRGRTLAHLVTVEHPDAGPVTHVTFHSAGDEHDVLLGMGDPFFPGWGPGLVAMVLRDDGSTDWDEVAELLTESYRLLAPKKLTAKLDAWHAGS